MNWGEEGMEGEGKEGVEGEERSEGKDGAEDEELDMGEEGEDNVVVDGFYVGLGAQLEGREMVSHLLPTNVAMHRSNISDSVYRGGIYRIVEADPISFVDGVPFKTHARLQTNMHTIVVREHDVRANVVEDVRGEVCRFKRNIHVLPVLNEVNKACLSNENKVPY